jgi:hypothetical protein
MIYMVEMDFRNPAREADWHVWYLDHVAKLIRNVPGFRATQRFRAITATPSPWLALHDVVSPRGVRERRVPRQRRPRLHRRVAGRAQPTGTATCFAGIDNTPEVPPDGHLLVLEADAKLPAP